MKKTKAKPKQLYALGIAKDWVEIREATKPPKAVRTQITKKVKVANEGQYHLEYRDGETFIIKDLSRTKDMVISVVSFTGGKHVTTMSKLMYYRRVGMVVDYGCVYEVPSNKTEAVLK